MMDVMAIKKFHGVLTTMGKLSKLCVMRLTKTKVFFIICDSPNGSGLGTNASPPSVWCELDPDHFFTEYHLEGVTKEDDEIYVELEPEVLAKNLIVLRSGHHSASAPARSLKVKLTRKHETPCLSFEIELFSLAGGTDAGANPTAAPPSCRLATHDFPVTLIPRKHWSVFKEPAVDNFDVSLYLPDLKQLRHVAEKYKSLGQHVVLEADRGGDLKFSMENERVNLSTYFKNLEVPNIMRRGRLAGHADDDEDIQSRVRVDLKRLSSFLSADTNVSRKILANFINERLVHFFLLHDDLCTQYLIPAVLE